MKQGSILINKNGDKRKILGVCGDVYFLSRDNDFELPGGAWTKKELGSCTLLEEPWEPKKREEYWFISDTEEIFTDIYEGDDVDQERKNFLGIYRTQELAEQALQEIKRKLGK